ncbi:MAG: S8 family serine peptidase [Candidatus Mcinerneyibacterium aminivorans]|uniref:S8 family serine peptidase n=1 Tax=Candidatus Mcinerneyibacterium aminivorans TaxID=2703815 RepID=A0A5D0MHB4_9BACT|nr:MAG: S8 family serine peptidase [Candidatus Mcinerneyibacterium aminivorans]
MKKFLIILLSLVFIFAFGCSKSSDMATGPDSDSAPLYTSQSSNVVRPIENQYIVVFKQDIPAKGKRAVQKVAEKLAKKHGIDFPAAAKHVYGNTIKGFAGTLNKGQLKKLRKDSKVKYIEQDQIISIYEKPPWASDPKDDGDDSDGDSSQTLPWGIERVGGPVDCTGQVAWVIDTGVDYDHPDLNVDTSRAETFITTGRDKKDANDNNGHGTHVAGTIAAIDNSSGVVGVAANATIVPVKVLDSSGSGSISSVVGGIDYVAANASTGDVANMSLGGGTSTSIDDATLNAAEQGIKFAVAAGNSSTDANNSSPARVNHQNIYTISAIDSTDTFASFSNYGNPPVDYAEPGVNILSLWNDGSTNTLDGTSMASPHMAGLLLAGNISTDGYAQNDPDGDPDPIGVH